MREERQKRRKRQQIITLVVCALAVAALIMVAGFELAMGTMMCREGLLKSCLEQYNKSV